MTAMAMNEEEIDHIWDFWEDKIVFKLCFNIQNMYFCHLRAGCRIKKTMKEINKGQIWAIVDWQWPVSER